MISKFTDHRRQGHTLVEVTVALALIVVVGAIVAQSIVWSLLERSRLAMHYSAVELASNVLEEARDMPIEQLDKTWADAQTIPTEMADVLPSGKLIVTIEPTKDSPRLKRVTAEVRWQMESGRPMNSVVLTTMLSARTAKKGSEP